MTQTLILSDESKTDLTEALKELTTSREFASFLVITVLELSLNIITFAHTGSAPPRNIKIKKFYLNNSIQR